MRRLVYSLQYRRKLKKIKNELSFHFGGEVSLRTLQRITDRLHLLQIHPESGVSLRGMYGVDTDYRYVYIAHNYVFYRVSEDSIQIINIFHEHEDYMLALFGAGSMEETQDRYINESGMSYNLL